VPSLFAFSNYSKLEKAMVGEETCVPSQGVGGNGIASEFGDLTGMTRHINSGCAGMTSEETAVPCPYREIVGTRHCRLLRLYHSDANGFDIKKSMTFFADWVQKSKLLEMAMLHINFWISQQSRSVLTVK